MNKLGDTGGSGGPRNSAGTVAVNRIECLTAAFIQDTNQIDDRIGAVDRRRNRRIVANIGRDRGHLADIAHRFAAQGLIRAATSNTDVCSLAGQCTDNRAAQKSSTTKYRDYAVGHFPS